MRDVLTLLRPRVLSIRNRAASGAASPNRIPFAIFSAAGTLLWTGIFAVFYRVLTYFQHVEIFGDLLAFKLLSMALVTFFSLLIFSGLLSFLSKLYLSRDLLLVFSLPLPPVRIFLARGAECALDSSWMVFLFSLPLFLSYGIVYRAGALFYVTLLLNLIPFCLIAAGLSAVLVLCVARVLPAGRTRGLFVILGLLLFVVLLVAFRIMKPEQFANPASFATLLLYFKDMESSNAPFLPTTWFYDSLRSALTGNAADTLFHSALLWSFCGVVMYGASWTAQKLYFQGLSRAQTSPGRASRAFALPGPLLDQVFKNAPGPVRAFIVKEIRTLFRDQAQWPQMFLLLALMAIYLYNFSVLPLDRAPVSTIFLQNLFAFLNMGLAAFVLTAVAARFVFPAVSSEGSAVWIVKSAPVSFETFLWIKYLVYFIPLWVMSELLIVATNLLLQVTPFMMALSVATMVLMVPGIVSLALCLGSIRPDFRAENPAQSATSLGGLLYMTLCMGLVVSVIVLEAGPVYTVFMTDLRGETLSALQWLWFAGSAAAVAGLCVAAFILPMKVVIKGFGIKGFD